MEYKYSKDYDGIYFKLIKLVMYPILKRVVRDDNSHPSAPQVADRGKATRY